MGRMKDIELALREAGFLVVNNELKQQIVFINSEGKAKVINYYEFFDLTILLGDYSKAATALKNGLHLKDFIKPEYKGLPIEWVYNMLVDNKNL